jgi:ribosomal protein S18 acetylase RimI-like enzyme
MSTIEKRMSGDAAAGSQALTVRPFGRGEWTQYRDLRLRALADSPDAFGSTLAQERLRSDAEWERRLLAGIDSPRDLPLMAYAGNEAVGLAWCRISETEPATAHLYQVWTAPEHRGQGAGRRLVETSIDWARTNGVTSVLLSVTCGDTAAARLYRRLGFMPVGEPRPLRPDSGLMEQEMLLRLDDFVLR